MKRDGWAALFIAAVLVALMWSAPNGDARIEVAVAQDNAARLARAYRATRDSIPALRAAFGNVERARQVERRRADAALVRSSGTTDSSRAVVADPDADAPRLRAQLNLQIATTYSLSAAFRAYLRADSAAHATAAEERAALYRALAAADTALTAKDRHIAALDRLANCRVLGLPCPSRKQAFIGGAVVAAVVIVVVRP